MRRREFLKVLAGVTLGTFGTPKSVVRRVFGEQGALKKKLKDAIEEVKDDPHRFMFLLGATYEQSSPDLRLVSAAVTYYIWLGGGEGVPALVREARKLKNTPGPRGLLIALKETLLEGPDEMVLERTLLEVEGCIIASVWAELTPVQMLEQHCAAERAQQVLDAYVEQYGSTIELLKMSDAEIEVPQPALVSV